MSNSASSSEQKMFAVRITTETKNVLDQILSEANNKDLGGKVKPESVLAMALSFVKKDEIEKLKAGTLTNADKLELRYREHVKAHDDAERPWGCRPPRSEKNPKN
jgi:hypothetical protein